MVQVQKIGANKRHLVSHLLCFCFLGASGGPAKNDRRTKGQGKKGRHGDDENSRNRGKTSLRIGSGRKGNRGNGRSRGSLKKRDRTAEKEAKEAAAEERRTVALPE